MGEILGISTNFEFKNGAYVKPPRVEETIGEQALAFLKHVQDEQDPEVGGMRHTVGGAQAGALRDIQRAQQNPELRVNHGDYAVIRNERVEDDEEFFPFQVVQIIEVKVDASDVITSLYVHECGGPRQKNTVPCHKKQTYKPRYKGIDPLDGVEKDIFLEGYSRRAAWMKPQYATIDPLTIVEWGKTKDMLTNPRTLNAAVLKTIHHQPRVEWTLPFEDLAINAKAKEKAEDAGGKRRKGAEVKEKKKTGRGAESEVKHPRKRGRGVAVLEEPAKKRRR